jgi:hypothetical protein
MHPLNDKETVSELTDFLHHVKNCISKQMTQEFRKFYASSNVIGTTLFYYETYFAVSAHFALYHMLMYYTVSIN